MPVRIQRFVFSVFFCLVFLGEANTAYCQSCVEPMTNSTLEGDLVTFEGPDWLIDSAISKWQSCGGYGTGFPRLENGWNPLSAEQWNVIYNGSGSVQNACGDVNFSTLTIRVWGGGTCPDPATILAHEMGHVLLLEDSECSNLLMTGYASESVASQPSAVECFVVDQIWQTPVEAGLCLDFGAECNGDESPILLDLDGNSFHLTGLEDPVLFDIDGDGELELVSWTRGGEIDAFLALDRNENGWIDNGSELFGTATFLTNGRRASHGYLALTEFDLLDLGGNGNGEIDPEDLVFGALVLWVDLDHDGRSSPGELLSLSAAGVTRISLRYRENRRTDRYGNHLRFNSRAWVRVGGVAERSIATSDVFFTVANPRASSAPAGSVGSWARTSVDP